MHKLQYEGKRFQVYTLEIEGHKKELVVHPGAVCILPFLDEETVLLIKNERFAVQKSLLELPAGTLEPKESVLECAYRELEEETGYLASSIVPLLNFYSSPGFCNEIIYSFVAKGLTRTQQKLDVTEKIEVVPMPLKEALSLVRDGGIQDGKTIATLLYYATNRN